MTHSHACRTIYKGILRDSSYHNYYCVIVKSRLVYKTPFYCMVVANAQFDGRSINDTSSGLRNVWETVECIQRMFSQTEHILKMGELQMKIPSPFMYILQIS